MKLFTPVKIGAVEIKNRLAMAPMGSNYADRHGVPTDQMIAYYVRRAEGGVGLVIFEASYVRRDGQISHLNAAAMDRDALIPTYRKLTDAIHASGAKVFMQLVHSGGMALSYVTGVRPVAPSITSLGGEIAKELSTREVEELVDAFAEAARRARDAGFDGVELHAAHLYLLCEFLSPRFNKRTDKYGGDAEARTRVVTEIVEVSKQRAGVDFPVIARINGEEAFRGGLKLKDAVEASKILQRAGVSAIHVSGMMSGRPLTLHRYPGEFVYQAEAVKKTVDIPVIAVGAITTPSLAEQILQEGKADMVAMGRPLISDPDLPNKAARGEANDIRECCRCRMCRQQDIRPQINCMQNFEAGREHIEAYRITRARQPKKVMVIGGGPGGMEAARVAALRGHDVTLYERGEQLGGQLKLALVAGNKEHLGKVIDYLSRQMGRQNVKVQLGVQATPELIEQKKPDVVVVATGATPKQASYPTTDWGGIAPNLVTAHDVLAGKAEVGKYVLVVGSGVTAAETAEVLAGQGKGVTLITRQPDIAKGLENVLKQLLASRLRARDVVVYTSTRIDRIVGKEVILAREVPGIMDPRLRLNEQVLQGIDTIVSGIGLIPNNSTANALKGKVKEVHVIGDAREAGTALGAIHEGSRVGRLI